MTNTNLYDGEVEWLLNSPDGPVGRVVTELAQKATATAKAGAPLQKQAHHSWSFAKSTSYMPWSTLYLKVNVRWSGYRYNSAGQLYSGVNAPFGPVMFLQNGGGRYGHAEKARFMSAALDGLVL